jgi:replicative DNA helicase
VNINKNFLEKLILKTMIVDPSFMSRISDKVDCQLFSSSSYNIVCDFFRDFWHKHGKLPSTSEIKLFATDNSFLQSLKVVYDDIHSIDLASIDKNILYSSAEKYIKEKLAISTLTSVIDKMGNGEVDAAKLVTKFEKIAGISLLFDKGYDIYKDLNRYVESLKTSNKRLSTGFKEIDKNINGGVLADGKCLSIVTAPTNMGKSIMLGNIAINAAKQGKNVLIISLEMSEEVYASRIYSALYNLPINSLSFMTEELKQAIDATQYGNVIIKEFPPATMSVAQIDSYIADLYKAGNKFDLICIDYLTLLSVPGAENSNEAGRENTRKLRALTYKYNIPIWTACQINREGMGEKTAELRHIAESIAIAAEADLILSLNQQPEDKELNIMRLTFLKSRLGPNGFTINLFFNQPYLRFEDMGNTKTENISDEDRNAIVAIENALTLEEIIEKG